MAGDTETGMMVMRMEEGLDTGPVALTETVAIDADMTAGDLHDALMEAGAGLMVEALARLGRGELIFTPQSAEGVTYAKKIDKAETRVVWTLPAGEVHNHIRALSPFPGAWCEAEIGGRKERLKLLRSAVAEGAGEPGGILDDRLAVACGAGAVRLVEVQRAGGKPVAASEFLRGTRIQKGMKLS
jgi:methionyl-tRNA formyltransferase